MMKCLCLPVMSDKISVFYWMQFRGWREIRWNKGNWSQDRLALTSFFEWTHRSLGEKINQQVPQFSFHIWGQSGFSWLKNLNMYNWPGENTAPFYFILFIISAELRFLCLAQPCHTDTCEPLLTLQFTRGLESSVKLWHLAHSHLRKCKVGVLSLSSLSLWLQNDKKDELMAVASRACTGKWNSDRHLK